MQRFHIYKNLAWLNDLPEAEAREAFLDCCGSKEWATRMTEARPFPMLEGLYRSARTIWGSLTIADYLEAFAAHPRIGASSPAANGTARSAKWSASEQSTGASSDIRLKNKLAEANNLYEEKFGFIFIVCATGRSADEMLRMCTARLENSLADEIRIAAGEQQMITELRLNKLLENERYNNTCP